MARIMLKDKAKERGTYVINVSFKDEDGAAITPTSITWYLTDKKGRVINSRTAVSIAIPDDSNDVVLTGADLALEQRDDRVRVFTARAVYNSTVYGNNLTLNNEAEFEIEELLMVT